MDPAPSEALARAMTSIGHGGSGSLARLAELIGRSRDDFGGASPLVRAGDAPRTAEGVSGVRREKVSIDATGLTD